jgi:Mn-dependent DtxR family transcriptional regulator
MIPAYKVPSEDIMEISYAVSQVGPDATQSEIQAFTGFSERKVTEGLKILVELNVVQREDDYTIASMYRKKINEVDIQDRSVLLNRALIQYRPFRTFGSFLRKGYPEDNAAKKTNVLHEIANDPDYIIEYFERLGSYAGLVKRDEGEMELTIEGKEIPVDSVESVEALRNALESEAEVRFWMEETVGTEIVAGLDEDTEDEIVKAFSEHAESPRDSITASGRALEDYLREVARQEGANNDKLEEASGTGQVANLLSEESIIRSVHTKRAVSLSGIRNKGGAHGDDQQTGNRWRTEAEVALIVAMETTLLISSIAQYVENRKQVL